MEIDQFIERTTQNVLQRMKYVGDELAKMPKGKISEEIHDGRVYFVQTFYENGKRIRRGINRNQELIDKLIRREILEEELLHIKEEKEVLDSYKAKLEVFKTYDLSCAVDAVKKRCPHLPEERIVKALSNASSRKLMSGQAAKWLNEEYEKSYYRAEELKQITSKGLKVRSKSEVLIAEKLYQYNIPFRYEQVIKDRDKILIIPDFTIRRSDGKVFYWEHEGLTNSQEYLRKQLRKSQVYASIDIVPWDNLIVTYDNADGIIDLRVIKSTIEDRLLV